MDYAAFGCAYFRATGLFVSVLHGNAPVYSSLSEMLGIEAGKQWQNLPIEASPCFCGLSDTEYFGFVNVEGTDWSVVVGPVFSLPLSNSVLLHTMDMLGIEAMHRDKLYECLCQTPVTSPAQLAKHLSLIYLTLNGKEVPDGKLYQDDVVFSPEKSGIKSRINQLESGALHNSYYFEITMYQMVREGNVENLNRFFRDNEHIQLNEGAMALSPLRHAKNVFISAVCRTGFIGAIPGGLDIEKTYQLMDDYIRRCEQLDNVEDVVRLQYTMVLDFCRRTGEARRPDNISTDVWHCMNYVRSHIYHPLTLSDLAADLGRSTSYVRKHFQMELGLTVGVFINRSKLEEAKTLLIYSTKSLAEISCDLCFSSQSYFQRLFKKEYGITPAQFRKQGRTI